MNPPSTGIYTLSLHDALPILVARLSRRSYEEMRVVVLEFLDTDIFHVSAENCVAFRSEEHTSELQSLRHIVCRLLLEKKKQVHVGVGRANDTDSTVVEAPGAG